MELPTINRFAMVVKPTSAYMEWAKKSPSSESELTLEELLEDNTAYLLPELEDEEAWLQENFKAIFEHELEAWCKDVKLWPKDQSFESFNKLFTVTFHSLVIDLGEDPLERDDE